MSGGLRVLGVIALAALLVGCGGSVADADSSGTPARSTRAVPPAATPFCAAVQANSDAIRPLNGLALRGTLPADQLSATVEAARISGRAVLNAAPDDIRIDVQRTVEALNIELNALVAAGGNASAAARDPHVMTQVNSPEVAAAGQRVSGYVTANCGRSR